MQLVLKEKVKCVREQRKCEEANKGLRGKSKAQKPRRKMKGKGWKIQGADSAEGENKMPDG